MNDSVQGFRSLALPAQALEKKEAFENSIFFHSCVSSSPPLSIAVHILLILFQT